MSGGLSSCTAGLGWGGPSAQPAHLTFLLLGSGGTRQVTLSRSSSLPATLCAAPLYSISCFLVPLGQAQGLQVRNSLHQARAPLRIWPCPRLILEVGGWGSTSREPLPGLGFGFPTHAYDSSCRLSRAEPPSPRPWGDWEGLAFCSSTGLQGIHSVCSLFMVALQRLTCLLENSLG